MNFLKKSLLILFLGAAVEGFPAHKRTFTENMLKQNLTRVWDEIRVKDPTFCSSEEANQVIKFLQEEWKKSGPAEKEFLKLMHVQPEFLRLLGTCKDEEAKEDSRQVIEEGVKYYNSCKNSLKPGLDLARTCLQAMGYEGQVFFLGSPVIKKHFEDLHDDGCCLGLSALYALCCLPKPPVERTELFPNLPLVASLEKIKGVGASVYSHLSEKWFWQNYDNIMCAASLKQFPPQERAHMSVFANLIHYLNGIGGQPSQEVLDYLGFPVTACDRVILGQLTEKWQLTEKSVEDFLKDTIKTEYPFVFCSHDHAVCLQGADKKEILFYDSNRGKAILPNLSAFFEEWKRYGENVHSVAVANVFYPKGASLPYELKPSKKRISKIDFKKISVAPLIYDYSISELKALFNSRNDMKINFWVDYLVTDKKEIIAVPGGTLSKWNEFLEEQIKLHPGASSFVKIFRNFISIAENTSDDEKLTASFKKAIPDIMAAELWLKPNPRLAALASDVEKATTSRRFCLLLEEYSNSEK
jgi:hypothetical protein